MDENREKMDASWQKNGQNSKNTENSEKMNKTSREKLRKRDTSSKKKSGKTLLPSITINNYTEFELQIRSLKKLLQITHQKSHRTKKNKHPRNDRELVDST